MQMEKNSFKEMEAQYINERGDGSKETFQKIESNINLFAFVSNILELYLPKAGNVIQALSSFDMSKKSSGQISNQDKNI